jgi:hypothetical protein
MRHRCVIFSAGLGFLFFVLSFATSALSATDDTQQPPSTVVLSHVRVVRLSFVDGTVTVRSPGSTEWAPATINVPIQEGFSVATDKKSFAEVQFENGSTVRLGELSAIDFTQLALTPQGGHINHLTLDGGYATLHVIPQRNDDYLLSASGVSLAPHGKTEFRTDLNQDHLRVEVFSGHVQATDSNQSETLAKNNSLVRESDPGTPFQVNNKVQKDDWDKWTDARERQSTLAYQDQAVGLGGSLYGWDDLDVYGEWGNFPGYGYGWAPYAPLGWSPYSSGMWGWYPGWGNTWISGEPWGWLPYHYGFWNFNPGMGWFWMPGSFNAWSPALVNWYSGPGWIGWAPIGRGGRTSCTFGTAGCLTAVPPSALRNGEPIRPGNPHVLHPAPTESITAIARPDVAPGRVTISSGQSPSRIAPPASGFSRGGAAAPSTVVMGQEVTQGASVGNHSSGSGKEPIHVRLGGTMGGQLPTATAAGMAAVPRVVSGESHGARGATTTTGAPQILPHASNGSPSRSVGGLGGGVRGGGVSPGRVGSGGASSGSGSSHAGGSPSGGGSAPAGSAGGHH